MVALALALVLQDAADQEVARLTAGLEALLADPVQNADELEKDDKYVLKLATGSSTVSKDAVERIAKPDPAGK